MGKIVAIGGASTKRNFRKLARFSLSLSKKKKGKLNVLIIPTATSDDKKYTEMFFKTFKTVFNCNTDALFLLEKKVSLFEIKKKIFWADAIYVSGGNTLMMMRRWRKLGVDKVLIEAYKKDIVLFGASAGAICWFEYGHSDSMSYYNKKNWNYIAVKGMGLIPYYGCPHFHAEKGRVNSFRKMVKDRNVLGFGIDNDSAFVVDGTKLYSISSNKNSGVFLIDACCNDSVPKKIKSKEVFGSLI